jgi:sugar lactone lactonase YvrE
MYEVRVDAVTNTSWCTAQSERAPSDIVETYAPEQRTTRRSDSIWKTGIVMREFIAASCTTDLYELGESCRWDEVRGELYWVDLLTGRFFRAKADGTQVDIVAEYRIEGFITALAPYEDRSDGWIVAINESVAQLDEIGVVRVLASPEGHQAQEVRANDGAADPWGHFWIGSMAYDAEAGRGSLYRFHSETGAVKVFGDVTISNGIGWSPDERTMYYVDTGPGTISAFDVDERGEISGRRVVVQFDVEDEGGPDGLCVDAEGALWVAVWGGYQVRRYSPGGELIARVAIPTLQPSSCAIGGENGTTLYVTTAREDMTEAALAVEPDAGRLFCADVGVMGLPLAPYRPVPRDTKSGMAPTT